MVDIVDMNVYLIWLIQGLIDSFICWNLFGFLIFFFKENDLKFRQIYRRRSWPWLLYGVYRHGTYLKTNYYKNHNLFKFIIFFCYVFFCIKSNKKLNFYSSIALNLCILFVFIDWNNQREKKVFQKYFIFTIVHCVITRIFVLHFGFVFYFFLFSLCWISFTFFSPYIYCCMWLVVCFPFNFLFLIIELLRE